MDLYVPIRFHPHQQQLTAFAIVAHYMFLLNNISIMVDIHF